jgi:hypothetical protein
VSFDSRTELRSALLGATRSKQVDKFLNTASSSSQESDDSQDLVYGTFGATGKLRPPRLPSVVVTSKLGLPHWVRESLRFTPSQKVTVVEKSSEAETKLLDLQQAMDDDCGEGHTLMLTYHMCRQLASDPSSTLHSLRFNLSVFDEVHVARNETLTKHSFRIISLLSNIRTGLSATPHAKSVVDLCHIADSLAYSGVAGMDDPKTRPAFIATLKLYEDELATERRSETKDDSKNWFMATKNNYPEFFSAIQSDGTEIPTLVHSAHTEMLDHIGPLMIRRPRTVTDNLGKQDIALGKLIQTVVDCQPSNLQITLTSEILRRYTKEQMEKRTKRGGTQGAPSLNELFGPFYSMARSLALSPKQLGFIWLGVHSDFIPIKIATAIDIILAIQREEERRRVALRDRSKFVIHCSLVAQFPEIVYELSQQDLYCRTLHGGIKSASRDRVLAEINTDADHQGDGGEDCRILLISDVGQESVSLWRFNCVLNLVSCQSISTARSEILIGDRIVASPGFDITRW